MSMEPRGKTVHGDKDRVAAVVPCARAAPCESDRDMRETPAVLAPTIDPFSAPPERQRAYRVPAMIERRALNSGFTATARTAAEPGRGTMLGVGAPARRVSVGTQRGHPRSTLCSEH